MAFKPAGIGPAGGGSLSGDIDAIFYVGWPDRFHLAERYADEVLMHDKELTDSDKLLLGARRRPAAKAATALTPGASPAWQRAYGPRRTTARARSRGPACGTRKRW